MSSETFPFPTVNARFKRKKTDSGAVCAWMQIAVKLFKIPIFKDNSLKVRALCTRLPVMNKSV
jgi:hypothetical protein